MRTNGSALTYRVVVTGAVSLVAAGCVLGRSLTESEKVIGLVVADFNKVEFETNLGQAFGTWDRDPADRTQFCRASFINEPNAGEVGSSLRLDYDVDSPQPAYNGLWAKLPSLRLKEFQAVTFAIRGDADQGFTRRLKVELKEGRRSAVYILSGIQPQWVRMRIPLFAFSNIEKLDTADEFVIVFDDQTVTRKVGAIYIDDVVFEYVR